MILLILMGVFALIGLIIGCVKGFTKVKSWAVEYLLATILTMLVGGALAKVEGKIPAIAVIVVAVVLVLLFALISHIVRSAIAKSIEKRKKLSYYEQYDEIHENEEKIVDAVISKDKSRYNKLSKRKFKQKGGAGSVVNAIFGGFTLAVKGAVIAAILGTFVLTVLDLAQLGVAENLGGVFYGVIWENLFKQNIFDFLVVGLILVSIKCGFQSGISNALWTLVIIGLVVFSGFTAYNLAFNVDAFNSAAGSLAETVSGWSEIFTPEMAETIARIILTAGLFAVMLVIVVLIGIFVPRLINFARDSQSFYIIDGIFGALFACVLVIGVLLILGSAVQSFAELEFMRVFNAYFEKSSIAIYFYGKNPIGSLLN